MNYNIEIVVVSLLAVIAFLVGYLMCFLHQMFKDIENQLEAADLRKKSTPYATDRE